MTSARSTAPPNPIRQAARLLEPEAVALLKTYVAAQWLPAGGCRNRSEAGDLYYTVFFLECAQGLDAPLPQKEIVAYLNRFGDGRELDFVHCACLARCRALLAETRADASLNRQILARLEQFRCADGGYNQRLRPGAQADLPGAIYEGFLAQLVYDAFGLDVPRPEEFHQWTARLQPVDGGFANEGNAQFGTTTVTAAAVILRARQGLPVAEATRDWLLARLAPTGGFLGSPATPLPDLLSTATALQALGALGLSRELYRSACLDFVEALWTNDGGFSGHIADLQPDCEYTYYGLLALGHLLAPSLLDDVSVQQALDQALKAATQRLLAERRPQGNWEGYLSSSALSTAVAVVALSQADSRKHARLIAQGLQWLAQNQNADGGWGDTTDSPSNLSTTLLCWSAFYAAPSTPHAAAIHRVEAWLQKRLGRLDADAIQQAVLEFYGQDRTFSAPILTVCALANRLGENGWERVPQLPFELAVFPHQIFRWLHLRVVSYAIPALIAIGLVRHQRGRRRRSPLFAVRDRIKARVLSVLEKMQPGSGGFLEATPLTGFVVLSLVAAGFPEHPVVKQGVKFLMDSARPDGSWPIDTNLATWVTTLAVNHLAAGELPLDDAQRQATRQWLLAQQHRVEHPFTHAAPGGWAWTDLSGGVPDADDTAGVLLALARLEAERNELRTPNSELRKNSETRIPNPERTAIFAGLSWLLDLQNSDGGIPTFCRGWGKLPFDRSCPDITAHALQAFALWREDTNGALRRRVDWGILRTIQYLAGDQKPDGSWIPLWFGHQAAPKQINATYGTAQVLISLIALANQSRAAGTDARRFESLSRTLREMIQRGTRYLLASQNDDGGWGGVAGVNSSIEETALAVSALAGIGGPCTDAINRGLVWLLQNAGESSAFPPAPIGLYFASLWYHEKLYPLIFTVGAFRRTKALQPARPLALAPQTQ